MQRLHVPQDPPPEYKAFLAITKDELYSEIPGERLETLNYAKMKINLRMNMFPPQSSYTVATQRKGTLWSQTLPCRKCMEICDFQIMIVINYQKYYKWLVLY